VRWLLALAACAGMQAAGAAEFQRWVYGATPALELQDMKGRLHRLADYRGKVVLVNFWATWCEPCRDEMPSIERLRASLKGEPFEVLAVNLAEPRSRIEHFLANLPLSFPILRDTDTQTAKAWRARMLPATYLVDASGRIRYLHYGELDWSGAAARARIQELLGSIPRSAPDRAERSADGANRARLVAAARASER
jgi:thiol-disulfide isomerase/thioredoxin